jgi:hypothetical protein
MHFAFRIFFASTPVVRRRGSWRASPMAGWVWRHETQWPCAPDVFAKPTNIVHHSLSADTTAPLRALRWAHDLKVVRVACNYRLWLDGKWRTSIHTIGLILQESRDAFI